MAYDNKLSSARRFADPVAASSPRPQQRVRCTHDHDAMRLGRLICAHGYSKSLQTLTLSLSLSRPAFGQQTLIGSVVTPNCDPLADKQ